MERTHKADFTEKIENHCFLTGTTGFAELAKQRKLSCVELPL